MKNLTFLLLIAILFLAACNGQTDQKKAINERDNMAAQIEALEDEILSKRESTVFDTVSATTYINRTNEFTEAYPQDTLNPVFLFKSGELSRGLGEFPMAIKFWNRVATEYPHHRLAPEALFLQGFTYDNSLGMIEEAAPHYELFLERYPKHPIANDVQMLLDAAKSGKTPDEMIKDFKQQQKGE